jgi:hypothetical protein
MKRLAVFLFVLSLILSACATSQPTQPPAISPKPPTAAPSAGTTSPVAVNTRAPSPTRIGPTRGSIALSVGQSTVTGGKVSTTVDVSSEGLGLGQIEVSSPEKVFMNETATISLRLSPAKQLAAITPVAVPTSADLPGLAYRISGNVQLYPVMYAELRALKFDVTPTGAQRRNIEMTNPAVAWNWLISPKAVGSQDISIALAIPALVNSTPSELITLQDILVRLQVQEPAVPTATPVPLSETITKSIANNAGPIIVALIGLIGTIIGIIVKIRSDQAKAESTKKK